ncbi:MAG TPA: helix-turn-helix domain-containing protein [Candidatus Bathyarchaeia archaeon]|nr:helix-turn-helix domain-containing protein [Candidatus Bathyarchaeia archaeon]
MSDKSDNLISLIMPLGINQDEARVYLYLLEKGTKTALQLSRDLHIARTRVYRILDKLIEKGLVSQKLEDTGKRFLANSYHQLNLLLKQREHEVQALRESIPVIFKELEKLAASGKEPSHVLYYSGVKGLKQVTWNSLKAKDELLIYEIADMAAFLNYGFCEKVREEYVRRKIYIRELTNLSHLPAWTKIKDLVKNYWQVRYIDSRELPIKFEVLVYNDVYAMYNYQEDDIFCIEVYNRDLADMQKRLFNFAWKRALKIKILNNEGEAQLTN